MLQPGVYNITALKKILGISERAWRERKEEILEHFKNFFDYEIRKEGRNINFYLKTQYLEYEPLQKKKDIEKIKAHYEQEIREIIAVKPYNTSANMGRNIVAMGHNLYEHQPETVSGYLRPMVKEKFSPPIPAKAWMKSTSDHLDYEPLTEEELAFLYELFERNSHEARVKRQVELFAEYRSGYIDEAELKSELFNDTARTYESLMSEFKRKFGFRPQLIKKLQEGAWANEKELVFTDEEKNNEID